ncbi:hypothetical protein JTB14_028147 [Gonioctena quinquepunctata]|nr:hypothetical protein JTB14_028147 [Gonioctena quinquepunctata]
MRGAFSKKFKHSEPLTQLEFRREISYLTEFGAAPKEVGRQKTAESSVTLNRVSDKLRYDRLDHLLAYIPTIKDVVVLERDALRVPAPCVSNVMWDYVHNVM